MNDLPARPIAIVGLGAVMPDAPDGDAFWNNIKSGRYSIRVVPPGRWDPALYYDPDPHAQDKTYSKIGGWVTDFDWDPLAWRLPIPPKVSDQMDEGQRWSVACSRAALLDAGWPNAPLDPERTAVILGNAIGGEKHYASNLRIQFPEFARSLRESPSFVGLPESVRESVLSEVKKTFRSKFLEITEDTMPGELANIIAGRVANLFNFRGPNFTTDAACASGLAAISTAAAGLARHEYDTAISGAVDRNNGVGAFVKFSKIGALSATGTRPFDARADGFVMGEGAAIFVLKRLEDAERDGNRIYAVLLGVGGSSDGKGKGITAPNPVGQRLALERAWSQAGCDPLTAGLVEAHGTSTAVGDVNELEALSSVFGQGEANGRTGSIALGSVKSNIGHLKAAAGVAGLFKAVRALDEKVLPPSLHFEEPNPNVDWDHSVFSVNTELRDWPAPTSGPRRAGVSAFGFGGTNFHVVLEEYVPGRYRADGPRQFAGADVPQMDVRPVLDQAAGTAPVKTEPVGAEAVGAEAVGAATSAKAPLRGALVVGAEDDEALAKRLEEVVSSAAELAATPPAAPTQADLRAPVRVAIDFGCGDGHGDGDELADKAGRALKALRSGQPLMWRPLRARGVFLGRGPAPKVAFLYTGQGSQYVNMLAGLRGVEPIVAETFAEADRIMEPNLGRSLSEFIFIDQNDPEALSQLEQQLLQTEITQPAVLTVDAALTRLLAAYGIRPDMVMGHSLGEYAALVSAGSLTVPAALDAVSARGRGMANLSIPDRGAMVAVMAPLTTIEEVVASIEGNVVVANVNSSSQAVIGGATAAVEQAAEALRELGHTAIRLPVSHAFHTSIVAPVSEPLMAALRRLDVQAPQLPTVKNVDGGFYPTFADPAGPEAREAMLDILGRQVASPVQFVKGLQTLYEAGARVFVEVGPKKALQGFAEDVLVGGGAGSHDDVLTLFTNHPKSGDVVAFNQALCGLYAAGLGASADGRAAEAGPVQEAPSTRAEQAGVSAASAGSDVSNGSDDDQYRELGKLFADLLDRGRAIREGAAPVPSPRAVEPSEARPTQKPVVVTGASVGLPGTERVFDDENLERILSGQQFIGPVPARFLQQMADKHITRLVKSEDGGGSWLTLTDPSEMIKLAGRAGALDLVGEFGVEPERDAALDSVTRLAIGAGFDAMRDAGIPLVQHYRTTHIGSRLPDRWGLPDAMRDDTGIIFASAFPGYDEFEDELERYFTDRQRRHELATLETLRSLVSDGEAIGDDLDRRIVELSEALKAEPYGFDRRFLFRVLSMGHSQFAEIIGARGPNTQINSACASTTQAFALAEDWISAGRCRRVIVISADNVSGDQLMDWVGAGFLATGAAATDERVEDAALPFDNRRHGMIIGMGAAGFVVESADAATERGLQPICEVLSTVTANSAFHGTRLDVDHIGGVMERLVAQAERRGYDRRELAPELMFVSHETYTPARGGSASAEISALRRVFGEQADDVVITNTKGFTGHAMGAGVEDFVAVKALETGIVPPIANFHEVDPSLGELNLSHGGERPVRYALRLAAGFGSQISMSLLRWTPVPDGLRRNPAHVGYQYRIVDPAAWQAWLSRVTTQDSPQLEIAQRRLRVVEPNRPKPPGEPARPATVPGQPVPEQAVPEQPVPTQLVPAPPAPAETGRLASPALPVQRTADVLLPETVPVTGRDGNAAPTPVAADAPVAVATLGSAATSDTAAPGLGLGREEMVLRVLSVVAEKTGYPAEMLDLDLDLEADLGIDTVKQAEVFASIRGEFGI
ncbi:MAG TPA: beta-ketoacyl synthase N-terminal-like domain-containing protein, partial [Frankiaceae bacterium]|nr:beta-ketoacyl synthase N-terminal-like domain-containing protein [Frankiaceae bacterium]